MLQLTRVENHTFVLNWLQSGAVVADLGGNLGRFSSTLSQNYGCDCFVAEPDPDIFERIPVSGKIQKLNVAIGGSDSTLSFYRSDNIEGGSLKKSDIWDGSEAIEVQVLSLPTFLNQFGLSAVDLMKVDIEGAEVPLLLECPENILKQAKQVTVEFHDFIGGSVTKEEVDQVIDRMTKIGFYVLPFSATDRSDVLFIRNDLISGFQAWKLRSFDRWVRALGRKLGKIFGR
jgi:FkbM family methyltransferase